MSEHKITLEIDLDKKPAQRSAEAFRKDQQRLNQQLLGDAETSERAQTALVERENRRRVEATANRQEGAKAEEAKALTDIQVAEAAKSAFIQKENQRRIAAEVQWLEAAKGSSAKALLDVEVKEAARTRAVQQANQRRVDAALQAMATEEERIGRLLSETEIAEAAKSRIVQRENEKRIASVVREAEGETKAERRTLTEEEVVEAAKTRIVQRENDKRIAAVVNSATAERREGTKLLSEEQIRFEAREKIIKRLNDERVDAAARAGQAESDSFDQGGQALVGWSKAVGSFAAQMLGLQSAQAIVGKIEDSFEKARDIVLESVEFLKEYREQLLELAALKDQLGDSTEVMREQIAFRAQTLQTRQSADVFQKAMQGAGESIIDTADHKGFMTPDEWKKFMVRAGSFQAADTGNPETHGTLAGLIPQNAGKRLTADEAFNKEQQLYSIFKPGAFTTFSSAANQYQKLTPLIMNGIYNDMQGASLMSAFSTNAKDEAGTMVEWFTRATVGALGRNGSPRVENAEPIGKYLKSLGADNQMSPMQIGDLIVKDMNAAEVEANRQGKQFNPLDHLKHKGFMNQEDMKSLMAYRGLSNNGQLASFMGLAEKPANGEAQAKIERFRSDPAGIGRRNALGSELAKISAGAPVEYYKQLMQRSYDVYQAENPGQVSGTFDEYMKDWKLGGQRRLHSEAAELLVKEYMRVGGHANPSDLLVWLDQEQGMGPVQTMGLEERSRRFQEMRDEISKLGGNILPGEDILLKRADEGLMQNKVPVPAPAAGPAAGGMPAVEGPQAMAPMGLRGFLGASLMGAMPGQADRGTVSFNDPRQGRTDDPDDRLIDVLDRLAAALEKQGELKTNPPRPLVEPRPAVRR